MQPNIALEAAQGLLLELAEPVAATPVRLWEAAGRILGEDIVARYSIPYMDRSAVDGYAVKASDLITADRNRPVKLNLTKDDTVGLGTGTCWPLGTGDAIPSGADAVIRVEDTVYKDHYILVNNAMKTGENIIPCGEDVQRGNLIASRGSRVCSPVAAVLAGQGINQVQVYRTVKVAIINTGGELLDPSQEFVPGKVYNSILYGLNARCYELNAEAISLGAVPDNTEVIAELINKGLEDADLLVITGGVSVGMNDLVPASLGLAGASLLFHGLAMKPGSPTLAANRDGKLVIGLSGNPAAALIGFELLVVPIIKKLQGISPVLPPKLPGTMKDNFNKLSPQRRFLRARLTQELEGNLVYLTGAQGNSVLTSWIGCNYLVDIPAGSGPLFSGQPVEGWLIGSPRL